MSALSTPEDYSDLTGTTVALGGYTSGSGVLNVASTSGFPTQQFHFYIADQTTGAVKAIGKATALNSGTQWSVSMTTDANAVSGDLVVVSLCAAAMNQIRADVSQYGVLGSLPSITGQKTGNRYKASDTGHEYYYDGAAWQLLKSGPVLVKSLTASTSASLDFASVFTSSFDAYEIRLINVAVATNNVAMLMRFSTNGGSTYDSSTIYDWAVLALSNGGSGLRQASSVSAITVADAVSNSANYSVNGTIVLFNPKGSKYKLVTMMMTWLDNSNVHGVVNTGTGSYLSTTAVDSVQFLAASGNLTSGVITVSGLPK